MNAKPLTDLFPPTTGSLVRSVFDCMEIAEEELKSAGLKGGFMALVPTPPLLGKSGALYRAHVKELIERIKSASSLLPGTKAECLATLLDTALLAPLNRSAQAVADYLFAQLFPDEFKKFKSPMAAELHKGQIEEDLAQMRRKLEHKRGGP